MSTKLKLLGVDVASIGDAHGKSHGARAYTFIDEPNGIYKKLVVSAEGQHLLGAVLVGEAEAYGNLLQIVLNGLSLPEHPEALILPASPAGAPGLGVDALPEVAQICSCNNVSKGQICAAIQSGARSLGALKSTTKASTTCGGCAPLVTQILNKEMARLGFAVKKDICEHFPHSRQELYHIVRVERCKTFEELLDKHGRGPRLRHLQAGGGLHPGRVLERLRLKEGACGAARHQRSLSRQYAEGRHLFGDPARRGRGDHP